MGKGVSEENKKKCAFVQAGEYMWKSVSAVSGHIRELVFLKSFKSWA